LTLSQAGRALARSRAWVFRLAAKGRIGQIVHIDIKRARPRKDYRPELESRFGLIREGRLCEL